MNYEDKPATATACAPCSLPPPGWTCSRKAGHDGPCAASATEPANKAETMTDTKPDTLTKGGREAMLLWSGGCDSTWALAMMQADEAIGRIRTMSLVHQNVSRVVSQRMARAKIAAKLSKTKSFDIMEVELHASDYASVHTKQGVLWLTMAQGFLGPDEDLYTGWIRGDDVWHHIHHLKQAFEHLHLVTEKRGKLVTPLEWMYKSDVVKSLQATDMYDDCWYCESGNSAAPCGTCTPCETHQSAVAFLERKAAPKP